MGKIELANLEKVDLRQVWANEALNFTNWLAQEDSLELLGNEIGIEMTLLQTEHKIGDFNVDILAEESMTNDKIVIENQLERTDHDHLGKIITYASGVDAKYIIWIVKEVREEHKRAIDWLNEHTDDEINIFAIQMEVWKISDSPVAPKFNIIAKPNEWAKAIKKSSMQDELSETKIMQLEFWTQFKDYASDNTSSLSFRKPRPQHWYDISIGCSEAHLGLTVNSQTNQIACEIYITNDHDLYQSFFDKKEEIENEISIELEWMELPTKKASRIKLSQEFEISNRESWTIGFKWLLENTLKFKNVFSRYI